MAIPTITATKPPPIKAPADIFKKSPADLLAGFKTGISTGAFDLPTTTDTPARLTAPDTSGIQQTAISKTAAPSNRLTPPGAPTDPTGDTAFDLERQKIDAQAQKDKQAQLAAIERQLGAQGIGDSGIINAAKRGASADILGRAAGARTDVTIEELQQREATKEAALNRALITSEGRLTRQSGEDIARQATDVQREGIESSERVGTLGILTTAQTAADRLGLDATQINNQNQQFYVEQANMVNLAQQGFSIDQMRVELLNKQVNNELATDMASLAQARVLADKGFDLQAIELELKAQGLEDADARFYAGLTADENLMIQETELQIRKMVIGDIVASLEPGTPEYNTFIQEFANSFNPPILIPPLPTQTTSGALTGAAETGAQQATGAAASTLNPLDSFVNFLGGLF